MVKSILLLFVCSVSILANSEIKLQAYVHLSAMDNVVATERVRGSQSQSYRIAVYRGRLHADRPYPKGLYVDQAWYSLLKDSLRWNWIPKDHYFTYSDTCLWTEMGRQERVPCSGEVFVQGNDVRSVTQTLSVGKGRMYPTVRMTVDYEFFQLGERRLLPARMTLEGGNEKLSVTWINYREFRASSEVVAIDEDDGYTMPVGKIVSVARQVVPVAESEVAPEMVTRKFDLAPVGTQTAEVKVKKRVWWKVFVVRVK